MKMTAVVAALFVLPTIALAAQFTVHVNAADASGHIRTHFVYNASGCHGEDVSPSITWRDAPTGTKGYAVTVYDPDAAGGWWHWLVLDIPAIAHKVPQGGPLPAGAFALKNSFGNARWDGPCPPPSDPPHHYVFTVYALDTPALGLSEDTPAEQAKAAIEKHALGKASVTYTYGR